MSIARFIILLPIAAAVFLALPALGQTDTTITIDATANNHPISPLIYGVAFASTDQLKALNAPLNRSGGNDESMYNWQLNASNHAADWYFESIADSSAVPGERQDTFVSNTKAGGAQPLLTVPILGWVAKLGPNRQSLWSYSVAKYGPQQKTAPDHADAGNGVKPDGKTNITGNDPNDANVPSNVAFEQGWVKHLIAKWGKADKGGVRYYIMDNEPMLWNSTHRDAHPNPVTDDEYFNDFVNYAKMVKTEDPNAVICGPESWGWVGYFYSAADADYRAKHGYQGHPDMDAHGGLNFIPWFLSEMRKHDQATGMRQIDYLTVHIYPQAGDGGNDISPKIQALRNRSTRALWDPNYKDESWINDTVMLIPRLKQWVKQYYPGTKIGITEYNWGAENSMSGATTQVDIFGIFGREGLDLATRWTTPDTKTPTFKAIQMYRNYDGQKSTFGDTSVSDTVPNPDEISSFAATRSSDRALTVMVINKQIADAPITLALSHFAGGSSAQVWQLKGDGSSSSIGHLQNVPVENGQIHAELPAQSVTLFIVPAQ
jgi:hypothetical protein